jgi:hypothetical protein
MQTRTIKSSYCNCGNYYKYYFSLLYQGDFVWVYRMYVGFYIFTYLPRSLPTPAV